MTEGGTPTRLIAFTEEFNRRRGIDDHTAHLHEASAVCQDALVYGIDVDDYVAELESIFGAVVREVPWLRFTDQTSSFRGCAVLLFPFWLITRVPARLRGEHLIPAPDPHNFPERLTLGHLARVIDAGHWIEP